MTNQTEAPKILRARHTNARVVIKDGRFHCEGCDGGYASVIALKVAEQHAYHCQILPLP